MRNRGRYIDFDFGSTDRMVYIRKKERDAFIDRVLGAVKTKFENICLWNAEGSESLGSRG